VEGWACAYFVVELASIARAACLKRGIKSLIRCPLSVRHLMNFVSIDWKSLVLFCSQYLHSSPEIRPFRQLGGCAKLGGM
jgi:hypothetical protein